MAGPAPWINGRGMCWLGRLARPTLGGRVLRAATASCEADAVTVAEPEWETGARAVANPLSPLDHAPYASEQT